MKLLKNISRASTTAVLLFAFSTCQTLPPPSPIPYRVVNLVLDLNDFRLRNLRVDRGFAYIEGGVRGIILYRRSANSYLAFERNCPFEPANSCATVSVDGSLLFMKDSCCNSLFDFEGRPFGGPAFNNMLRYNTNLSGNILYISN